MEDRNYYEILGVEQDASQDEIKQAYREMAKQYHPDRDPDDPEAEEKFKAAAEAYDVLGDPEKRRRYAIPPTVRSCRLAFSIRSDRSFTGGGDLMNE